MFRAILLFATIGCSCLFAQEYRPIKCRFLNFGGREDVTVVNYSGEGAEITCTLLSQNLSDKVVCYAKDNQLSFFSKDKKPYGSTKIASNINTAIVIFVQKQKNQESKDLGANVFIVEDDPRTFPDGGVYFTNFFNKDIRVIVGEQKVKVPAGQSHVFPMPKQRDAFNMSAVVCYMPIEGRWETATETALHILPDLKYLMFAYVDPYSKRAQVRSFRDVKQVEVEKPVIAQP